MDLTTDKSGLSTVLSQVKERILMGPRGYPLTKYVVKSYLEKMSRTTRFNDNLPQIHFVNGFLEKHPERLTVRSANLIKTKIVPRFSVFFFISLR